MRMINAKTRFLAYHLGYKYTLYCLTFYLTLSKTKHLCLHCTQLEQKSSEGETALLSLAGKMSAPVVLSCCGKANPCSDGCQSL